MGSGDVERWNLANKPSMGHIASSRRYMGEHLWPWANLSSLESMKSHNGMLVANPFAGLSSLSVATYRRPPSFAAKRDKSSVYEGNNPEPGFLRSIDRVSLA